jgi:hypothetical protein
MAYCDNASAARMIYLAEPLSTTASASSSESRIRIDAIKSIIISRLKLDIS